MSDFDEQVQLPSEDDQPAENLPPLLSLRVLTGIRIADTMQVKVRIGNHEFTALLDSGSTP